MIYQLLNYRLYHLQLTEIKMFRIKWPFIIELIFWIIWEHLEILQARDNDQDRNKVENQQEDKLAKNTKNLGIYDFLIMVWSKIYWY